MTYRQNLKMYTVVLACPCENAETEKEKALYLTVAFESEEAFDMCNDMGFDLVLEQLNSAIEEKYPGYFINDCVECDNYVDEIDEIDEPDLTLVTDDNGEDLA